MKKQIKKGLSLIMAVLMVLSCWVWVAPSEAEAIGGNASVYYYCIDYKITDTADTSQHEVRITYKTNNGTGSEETKYIHRKTDESSDSDTFLNTGSGNTQSITGALSGFPTYVAFQYYIGGGRSVRFEPVEMWIGKTQAEANKRLAANKVVNSQAFEHKPSVGDGGVKSIGFAIDNFDAMKPYPNEITGFSDMPVNLEVPKIGTGATIATKVIVGDAYDQYGVAWAVAPDYNLSTAVDNFGADETEDGVIMLEEVNGGAKLSVTEEFQKTSLGDNATVDYKEYYLVAHIEGTDMGSATASQPIRVVYPKYEYAFITDYVTNPNDEKAQIALNNGSYFPVPSINASTTKSEDDKKFIKTYGQTLATWPVSAVKEGYTFYGFWTVPQPAQDVTLNDSPYAYVANFRQPVDTKTYNELYKGNATLEAMYCPAGEKWDPNNAELRTTTGDKTYYAWFLAKDVTVKFYGLDGKYISDFTTKFGRENNAAEAVWPERGVDFLETFESGAYSYSNWNGTWEDINGDVVNPSGYRFTRDLVLTPVYRTVNFADTYSVTVYTGTRENTFTKTYTKEYKYRDTAVMPTTGYASMTTGDDYSYEFIGWSTQKPTELYQGVHARHILEEDADFDLYGNAIYLAEDFIVRRHVSYYPVYRRYLRSHDVSFTYTNLTGTQVTVTKTFKYNEVITPPDDVPAEYASNGNGYKLLYWTAVGEADEIDFRQEICKNGTMAYAAKYSEGVPTPYDVTFEYRDKNGEIKQTTVQVNHGSCILEETLNELAPASEYDNKETNELETYAGVWEYGGVRYDIDDLDEFSPTSHVKFTAVYENGRPFYTATYVDGSNTESFRVVTGTALPYWTVEKEVETEEGGEPVFEDVEYIPVREETLEGEYIFAGWSDKAQTEEEIKDGTLAGNVYVPGSTAITGDVRLYPQFTFSRYEYTITFLNWDGEILKTAEFNYHDDITALEEQARAIAQREADNVYTYTFLGWDKVVPEFCEGGEPGSETIFVAQYKSNYIYYDIEWYNSIDDVDAEDETALSVGKYIYGDKIHVPGVTVTPPADAPEGQQWVLGGWKYEDVNGDIKDYVRGMVLDTTVLPADGGAVKMWAVYVLTEKTYTIGVTVNDGVNTPYSYSVSVADGDIVDALIADPVSGYLSETHHNEFIGWFTKNADDEEIAFDITAPVSGNAQIYAKFQNAEHEYTLEEVVAPPTYPMDAYTDLVAGVETPVAASNGKGVMGIWCACSKEKTYDDETKTISALEDEVAPGSTGYIGTAGWSDFDTAAAAGVVYANPNTDLIITTSDKGDYRKDFNETEKGIGIEKIDMIIVKNDADITQDDLSAENADFAWENVYDWATIQKSLIEYYGGWAKVPAMYKDYRANFTNKLGAYGLEDGETYVAYIKVTDKADNVSYMRTADFLYDATAPVVTIEGLSNAQKDTFCEQATLTVTETSKYAVTDNGIYITRVTGNTFNVNRGVHQIVVTDQAGNKTSLYFQVLEEHSTVDYNEDATCLKAGFTSKRCTNCGSDIDRVDIDALGHNLLTVTVPATCTENGYDSTYCTRCDLAEVKEYYQTDDEGEYVLDEDGEKILLYPVLGHNWNEGTLVKAATCSSKGLKNYVCIVCGATKQEELAIDDAAHSFYPAQILRPTCVLDGERTQTCRLCGETVVIAHGYEAGDDKFDAENSKYTAENFNAAYKATNHASSEELWVVTTAVTCFSKGIETKKCSICNATIKDAEGKDITREITALLPHTWVVDEANSKAPTVEEEGYIAYKCSVEGCTATKRSDPISKLQQYTVKFMAEDGTEVKSFTDRLGVSITADMVPAQTKADSTDGKFRYEFAGWFTKDAEGNYTKTEYKLPMEISADLVLYAKFKEIDIYYTVKFKAPTATATYDDKTDTFSAYEEVKELMGPIGEERLPAEKPSVDDTDYYTFTFDGWEKAGVKYDGKITGDATYQASFKVDVKKYNVIYMSQGEFFNSEEVVAGEDAALEDEPTKASDDTAHYTFTGWYTAADCKTLADLTDISEKTTVYAGFKADEHNADDNADVEEASCTEPEITTYKCVECEHVWSEQTADALGHTPGAPVYNAETGKNEIRCTVCTVLISDAPASYTIVFEDHNGRRLDTLTVQVNKTFTEQAKAAEKLASKASDDKNNYTFAGWVVDGDETNTVITSDKLPAATANVKYIASYTATARVFTVTFASTVNDAKTSFSEIKYGETTTPDGKDVTAYEFDADVFGIPAATSNVHYVFKSWDNTFKGGVTADMLVRPVYEAVEHDFDTNGDNKVDKDDAEETKASCTESGGYKYTCADCGYYYITGNIKPLEHNWVTRVIKEPTFTEPGLAKKICQRCDAEETEEIPMREYITVTVTVKDSNGKTFEGAKVTITHQATGKQYGPNLTNGSGVATFKVEEAGQYFASVVEIPGHDGGISGNITVDESGKVTEDTIPVLKGETNADCSCACHRSGFWGTIFRLFHKLIKLLAGRYICCDCPDSKY